MKQSSPQKTVAFFLLLVVCVVFLSTVSVRIWGGKPETIPVLEQLKITDQMTLRDFGQANNLPNPQLKVIFNLQQKSDLQKDVASFGTPEQIQARVKKKMALSAEHASKNWQKIVVKFLVWFTFLFVVFFMFRNKKVTQSLRNLMLFISVIIFGVVLGADPSPMGTVKDAIHLFGSTGAIFPPRLIALTVFLIIVFLANKFICSWGCQVGTLQDLVFRLNQDKNHKGVIEKQIKIPFIVTNSIRVLFLVAFTVVAFSGGSDIIEPIDPFKIFKPMHMGVIGIGFVGLLLLTSLFIYRPWCHFFCPFGLAGWVVEKISLNKVSVDYSTCIACKKCEQACPSTVMGAILKQDKKTVPDCFSCYVCRDVCPTGSISFSMKKRSSVPAGFFDKKHGDEE